MSLPPRDDAVPGEAIVSPDTRRPNRLPPGQTWTAVDKKTATGKWPVLHYGSVPKIDLSQWQLRLFGLVENEWSCDWAAFNALPTVKVYCDIHCVTSWSRKDNLFEGPSVREVCRCVGIEPLATHVLIHSYGEPGDNWTTNLPLNEFLDEDCVFATKHNGKPLSDDHGGPMRLVVPKLYFWKSAKWVRGVEFLSADMAGFWEQNGYHMHGDPWTEERYGG